MGEKKIIVIGAGISGLAAGCYLQMNGYDTEIFELHSMSGGLCTAWKRKGYTFDGCIHWLCGSNPKDELYTIWEELGLIKDTEIIDHEMFMHTDFGDGRTFSVYANPQLLEQEMLKYSPEDKDLIKDFIKAIVIMSKANLPVLKAQELFSIGDGLRFLIKEHSALRVINKWNKISMNDFQRKFKNPFFNQNFVQLFGIFGEMPVFGLIYTLGLLASKNAGYPIGGSLKMIDSVEKRYLGLGGKINYSSRVEKILVENNKAVGVELQNGIKHNSDMVISAADGHYTIYNMLGGKFINSEIEGYYKDLILFPSIFQVSLGLTRRFNDTPDTILTSISLGEPIYIDPKNILTRLELKNYIYDQTLAPEGHTVLTTNFHADYEYWVNLKKNDLQKYHEEKNRIASEIIDRLDLKFGDIKNNVGVYDVATPYTYENYTNNWKGSFEGFIPTVGVAGKKLRTTLPGLEGFYMIGQWVQPGGGLPTGGMMGRHITQIICKNDKKEFRTVK